MAGFPWNQSGNGSRRFDLIIVGGGLAGCLLGARLKQCQPQLNWALVEERHTLGGGQTWSFHEGDLGPEALAWVRPFVTQSWPDHQVVFPQFTRVLPSAYHSIASEPFFERMGNVLKEHLVLGTRITQVKNGAVTLHDNTTLHAEAWIDARGLPTEAVAPHSGFQKFVGWDVEFAQPHGIERPVLMDTGVPQTHGYHFCYFLPWSPTRLLIEDTAYTLAPHLAEEQVSCDLTAYIERRWPRIPYKKVRAERGVLPIPLASAFFDTGLDDGSMAVVGTRAGLFHFTTGYSLPDAVRVVSLLEKNNRWTTEHVRSILAHYKQKKAFQRGFYLFLNRVLFKAAAPQECVNIFSQFYKQKPDFIRRFYAGETTTFDKIKLFSGKPPIAAHKILKIMKDKGQTENQPSNPSAPITEDL